MENTESGRHVSRADLLLGIIPSVYIAGFAAQATLSVSLPLMLALASAVAATGLVDALVVHPPA
ncbi:MAG: hypothetical protein IH933_01445 [Euryarchaeota archaeon]|nr:hypothetical protein [Euryarchaeota archaeon]